METIEGKPTLTDVAAYSKNGKSPDDHKARSRFRPSGWEMIAERGTANQDSNADSRRERGEYAHRHPELVDGHRSGGRDSDIVTDVWQQSVFAVFP